MATDKKLVRSKSGLRMVTSSDSHRSPFEMCEPPWLSDRECSHCCKCQGKFDFIRRRHHCRRCGRIFCKDCCDTKLSLYRMCFIDPVRICNDCTEVTRKENDFYDKHLKTLMMGANFIVTTVNTEEESSYRSSFLCKLSSDHRFIVFDGTVSSREPVDVSGIQSAVVVKKAESDFDGHLDASELKIVYTDAQKSKQVLHFTAASVPNRKLSVSWIIALHKAVKLMNEAQNTSAA